MPNVFKVPDAMADKYHGAGYALAAAAGGQLIDLVYLADLLPDLDEDDIMAVQAAVTDERIGPTVRYLSGLGEVFVGMCSCWEFVEI